MITKAALIIVIKIFADRIIFSNPGRIFGNLTVEDLQRDDYVSSVRNRLLAEAFYLTGDIERYGTGFIRIREALKAYPEFSLEIAEIGDYFLATLNATPQITPQISSLRNLPLTALEQKMLECVAAEPRLSRAAMASRLGVGQDTVKEYLGRLKKKGMVIREGNPKSGSGRVTESGKAAIEEKSTTHLKQ